MPKLVQNKLTAKSVLAAPPGRHADGLGLYLMVKDSGSRSWVYRYTLNKRTRDLGLGPAGQGGISLADARDRAAAMRLQVKAGTDPLVQREKDESEAQEQAEAAKRNAVTFRDVATAYIAANESGWKNSKHRQQWRNTLATYVYPVIGDLPVNQVTTEHVLSILKPIWNAKPESAKRVRGRIETVLSSAKAQGFRSGENPAQWRDHLAHILPVKEQLPRGHHKALPYADVPQFIANLQQRKAIAALALEFTILTACRTSEVTGATWPEFDLEAALWTIPAERMKAGKEHVVPLTGRCMNILGQMKAISLAYAFPAAKGGPLSNMAMAMLLRRMEVDVTVHGFRSTFRDWAAECTNHQNEVAEMALAHTIQSKVERAYRRGIMLEKRRNLMNDWEAFCVSASA